MSRSKRFISGLLTGYASIGVNILYTIASIPLALHYLSKEEFGIWALVTQLSGYLLLLEFGMRGSIARALSDHKDDVTDGVYGSILRTGTRVFIIQGFAIILLGCLFAWLGAPLLKLPADLVRIFTILMGIQALICGVTLATEAIGSPLWCHQRLDVSNLITGINLVVSFITLWIGFHLGWKLYSLILSSAIGLLVSTTTTYFSCRFLKLYPPLEHRGNYSPILFRELLHFGSGLFMMNLGAQLTSASQVIIISRLLGVEVAAVWAISTKLYNMSQQFVSKVLEASAGGLTEMFARGESQKLKQRFQDVTKISAIFAVTTGTGIALINGPFVEIWTDGKITWEPWNNYLLGCLLFTTSVTRCHIGLVGVTKHIRGMKYINLAEGIIFVGISISLARLFGITGILGAAIICNVMITGYYSIARTSQQLEFTKHEVIGWAARPMIIMTSISGLFLLLHLSIFEDLSIVFSLGVGIGAYIIIVLPIIWLFGISTHLKQELKLLFTKMVLKVRFPKQTI